MIQQQGVEIKYRTGIEGMKQEGATKRTLIQATADAHDTNAKNESMQHSTEVKALTAQNVEEIRGLVKLLSDKMNGVKEFEMAVAQRDHEQQMKAAEVTSAEGTTTPTIN